MKKELLILIVCLFAFIRSTLCQTTHFSGNATVNNVKVYRDARQDGHLGIMIHANVTINNMLNKKTRVNAYFYDAYKQKMRAVLSGYKTNDYQASMGKTIIPRYANSQFTDLKLFMPYDALASTSGYVRVEVEDITARKIISNSNMYKPFNLQKSNNSSQNNSNQSNNNSQNNNNNQNPQIKVPVYLPCPKCGGGKTCSSCGGQRVRYYGNDKSICITCNGSGICDMCHGTGTSMVIYQ